MSPNKAFLPLMALLLVGIGLLRGLLRPPVGVALKLRLGEIVSRRLPAGLHCLVPI